MPDDPKEFDNKGEFMDSCMHQLRKVEHKDQAQSVAICLNQWRDKNKKARRVVAAFLGLNKESGIITDLKKIPRLKDRLVQQQQKDIHGIPQKGKPFAKPGEEITELLPGGKEEKRPYKTAPKKVLERALKPMRPNG